MEILIGTTSSGIPFKMRN